MARAIRWLIAIAVIGGIVALWIPVADWLREQAKPKYLTASVTRGRVETAVNSTGTVKPVRTVTVGAFTSGPIAEIDVDFNSRVKKGQRLALIDPLLNKAAVDRDRAFLETQKADLVRIAHQLQQAINDENRARKLLAVNSDYLSGTEMDSYYFKRLTLEAQKKLAEASIVQAAATLKNSETNLAYTNIIAPEDGVVIDRKVDKGQTVAASFQTPELFTIAPEMEQHMFVFANVDEADIGMIHSAKARKQTVKFVVDAYPGHPFEGVIDQIRMNSTTTQNVVTYPVVVEAPNKELKLMPGMTANITFPIESRDNVLRAPAVALRFTPQKEQVREEDRHYIEAITAAQASGAPGVKRSASEKAALAQSRQKRVLWVQDGDLLKAIPVTLGLMENQFVEIVEGDVAENQAIVIGLEGILGQR